MAKTTQKAVRFTLPARIRGKRNCSGDLAARMALIERISDLADIETVECNDEAIPGRVDIYVRREASDRVTNHESAPMMCCLDVGGITVNGLNRWDRYKVLANGWGKLVDAQVCVYWPRDHEELEIVWRIIRQAYDGLSGTSTSEPGSAVISTQDFPRFSRTSLQ